MPLTDGAARRTTGSVTDTDRAALVRSLRADVDAARRTHGEMPREESIRFWARRLGIPAPELSAAIGTWPACAGDD